MRLLFLLAAMFVAGCVRAQMPQKSAFDQWKKEQSDSNKRMAEIRRKPLNDSINRLLANPYLLRPGVHFLPLDRTICLVPYTKNIAPIPNAGIGYRPPVAGRIPNVTTTLSAIIRAK